MYLCRNVSVTAGPLGGKKNFVFSTDSYYADSIKSQERLRRGCPQQFIIEGPATKKPSDNSQHLTNGDNKTQLCKLLLRVWGSEQANTRLERSGTSVVVVESKAYDLNTSNAYN